MDVDIEYLKNNNNELDKYLSNNNIKTITFLLKKLGKLPKDFSPTPLLKLLKSDNDNIRYLAVKNLAKLCDYNLMEKYIDIIKNDKSSEVRREATSAIGRMRNKKAIPTLIYILDDRDPEVVLQALRGLLIFKKEEKVIDQISKLNNHPNEIIKKIVNIEFNNNGKKDKNKIPHSVSPDYLKNVVIHGDVRDIICNVPSESVHLTFTSPPYYNARDYSIYQSYEQYLNFLEAVFKEVYRITKEGRFFILNTSPIIIPRVGRKYSSIRYPIPYDIHTLLLKMGWEFIDDIIWVKPEASTKNRVGGFLQHRKPLAYKPNSCTESVMVYRKKTNKLIDWNIKQYSKEIIERSKIKDKFESSNVWKIDPVFDKTHSAVFPLELCDNIVKYYSFEGDLVFDPFAGSGTFGKSALKLNRYFFLTEKEEKYIERIKENVFQSNLLTNMNFPPKCITNKQLNEEIKNDNYIG